MFVLFRFCGNRKLIYYGVFATISAFWLFVFLLLVVCFFFKQNFSTTKIVYLNFSPANCHWFMYYFIFLSRSNKGGKIKRRSEASARSRSPFSPHTPRRDVAPSAQHAERHGRIAPPQRAASAAPRRWSASGAGPGRADAARAAHLSPGNRPSLGPRHRAAARGEEFSGTVPPLLLPKDMEEGAPFVAGAVSCRREGGMGGEECGEEEYHHPVTKFNSFGGVGDQGFILFYSILRWLVYLFPLSFRFVPSRCVFLPTNRRRCFKPSRSGRAAQLERNHRDAHIRPPRSRHRESPRQRSAADPQLSLSEGFFFLLLLLFFLSFFLTRKRK